LKVETVLSIRGLVSGATTMTPCCAANCWKPDFVMKFCSVQVSPGGNIQTYYNLQTSSYYCLTVSGRACRI